MLAGNMGQGAVNVLGANGIQVLRGCSGDVKAVAENWLFRQPERFRDRLRKSRTGLS
jgi:predicted Fe-Mo cluster-binding NifX family protein